MALVPQRGQGTENVSANPASGLTGICSSHRRQATPLAAGGDFKTILMARVSAAARGTRGRFLKG